MTGRVTAYQRRAGRCAGGQRDDVACPLPSSPFVIEVNGGLVEATSLSKTAEQSGASPAVAEDERLALGARSNPTAFATLYGRHRESVFRYLRARCTNDDDALDLTAVTFERALVAIQKYRALGAGFSAWVLRIARNAAIDHSRRQRARPTPAALESAEGRPAADDPEATAIASDEHRRLRALVRALPEPQRDALALRYSAGLTAREIGVVIGKSEEATQKLITRALSDLKEAYAHEQR
jgi:RNA polymerase sigma-70 factor (ECF subfamily)